MGRKEIRSLPNYGSRRKEGRSCSVCVECTKEAWRQRRHLLQELSKGCNLTPLLSVRLTALLPQKESK